MKPTVQVAAILAIVCLGFASRAEAPDVWDQFDASDGFSSLAVSGDASLATLEFVGSSVVISHAPRDFYNSASTSKSYSYDLSKTTWFDFRFRMEQQLLGQDMYTTLTFVDPQGVVRGSLTIGINSEQHWRQVYADGSNLPPCTAKTSDDELFISVSGLFSDAHDTRLHYPSGFTKPYTAWTVFSVKYDPPGASGDPARGSFAFFVDGDQVPLRDLDANPPTRSVNTYTTALNGLSQTTIKLELAVLVDGFEYGYTGNKQGVRARGCYARKTPALPSAISFPAKFSGNNGAAFKGAWMQRFDALAALMINEIKGFHSEYPKGYSYEATRSTPSWDSALALPANPLGMFGLYASYYQYLRKDLTDSTSIALRRDLAAATWNGIYAGSLDFVTAVLMGAIDLPGTEHVIWQYNPPGTRDGLLSTLSNLNTYYPPSMSQPERYIWDTLYSGRYGGTWLWSDAVQFGYLEPAAVRHSPAWPYLQPAEQAAIPADSVPTTSVMYWDYFRISRTKLRL